MRILRERERERSEIGEAGGGGGGGPLKEIGMNRADSQKARLARLAGTLADL